MKEQSTDFKDVADSAFETLLTVTTILSGVYTSMTFGWFSNYFTNTKPEMLSIAMTGVIFGLIFILPVVVILMSWFFAKFKDSMKWRTMAWAGLFYCLTQDIIGIVGLFGFSLILAGLIHHELTMMITPLIIFIPPIIGMALSYKICMMYNSSIEKTGKGRCALTALLGVFVLLVIQGVLGLIAVYFGEIL